MTRTIEQVEDDIRTEENAVKQREKLLNRLEQRLEQLTKDRNQMWKWLDDDLYSLRMLEAERGALLLIEELQPTVDRLKAERDAKR